MTLLPDFELIRPLNLAELAAARRDHPGSRLLAGGTDLIPNLRRGLGSFPALIDVTALPGLADIVAETDGLRIGAAVTLAQLAANPLICANFPALAEAARQVAGPSHRAVATLGGNLCLDTRCVFYNQSAWWRESNAFCLKHRGNVCHVAPTGKRCHAAYSGDTAPVLLALGASVELGGTSGTRWESVDSLFQEDGAAHLRLADEDVLLAVRVPFDEGLAVGYEKVRLRASIDFPLAGVAVALRRNGNALKDLRIALTGTNSRPITLAGCEPLLDRPLDEEALRQIGKLVQKQVSPMRTTTTPAHYRRRVAAALATRLTRRLYAAQG